MFKRAYTVKLVKRNLYTETLMFMLCNGLLMYMLSSRKKSSKEMWFFMPNRTAEKQRIYENSEEIEKKFCSHNESCIKYCTKVTAKYLSFAYAFSVIKIMLTKVNLLKTPKTFLKETIKMKNLNFVLFFGAYVSIYEAINCYLTNRNGGDYRIHTFTGGFLAGASYFILAKYTVLASLITVLLKVTGQKIINKYKLPEIPYAELIFIFTNAYLLKTKMFFHEACPRIFLNIMESCSNGRSERVYSTFLKLITEIINSKNNHNGSIK